MLSKLINENLALRDDDRRPTDAHILNLSSLAFYVEFDSTRPMYEIALLNYESGSSINWFDIDCAVIDQVRAQGTARASRRRVFRNVIARRKHSRMRAGFTSLNGFASKSFAAGAARALVDVSEQRAVYFAAAQIS